MVLLGYFSAFSEDQDDAPHFLQPGSATINALTVSKERHKELSGHLSQMRLTVSRLNDSEEATHFEVGEGCGETLRRSLSSVERFFTSKRLWPKKGFLLGLGFADASHPHDGESFSLGVALLYDALVANAPLAEHICVTGHLEPDGSVIRVGGLRRKIDAAAAADASCPVVIIPAENGEEISDRLILEGPEFLSRMQIIGVENFAQAQRVTTAQRSTEVAEALRLYSRIGNLLKKHSEDSEERDAVLANERLQKALTRILTIIPEHLSARYLTLVARHEEPVSLSPKGSLRAIDRIWPKVLAAGGNTTEQIRARRDAVAELDHVEPLLAPCSDRYAAAVRRYAELTSALEDSGMSDKVKHEHLRKEGSEIDTERRYLQKKLNPLPRPKRAQ